MDVHKVETGTSSVTFPTNIEPTSGDAAYTVDGSTAVCATRSSSTTSTVGVASVVGTGPNNDIEVLNISTDPKSPYGIQFDDIDWEEQLPSLKPLGEFN